MKNKNYISAGLLISIIVLVGIAACYYVVKKDAYDKALINDGNNITSEKGNSDKDNTQYFKTINRFSDFEYYVNRRQNSFIVFGKEGCHFCNMYKPVLEKAARELKIEVIYVDLGTAVKDDYYNILNMNLIIPSKCTKDGVDTPIVNGFGTPLSLFVNEGATYDCIRGYKDYDTLVSILKQIGYINN